MRFVVLSAAVSCFLWATARAQEGEDGHDDQDIEEESLTDHQLRALHTKFDSNGDGRVSMLEIMDFAHETGKTIAGRDIQTILEEVDTSKDGRLSLDEHMDDIHNQADGADEEEQRELAHRKRIEAEKFRAADRDGDQHLDVSEAAALFYPETHEPVLTVTVAEALRQKDKNGDGRLSPHEFWEADAMEGDDGELSEEEMQDFAKLDINGDGFVDVSELRPWESGKFHTESAMKQLFELADLDNDMHVTAVELTRAREAISVSDAQYHLVEWAEHNEL